MSTQTMDTDYHHNLDPIGRIPAPVRESLTPEQISAVSSAVGASSRHPVDVRLTLPLPGRPVFFSIMAGRERRSGDRLAAERRQHPLHTLGNIVFMLTSLTGIYALALVAALMFGSVLEF